MYSRMSCAATLGLTQGGAQQGRGRFIRPNRASSANMMRSRRPRRAAARLWSRAGHERPRPPWFRRRLDMGRRARELSLAAKRIGSQQELDEGIEKYRPGFAATVATVGGRDE